MGLIQTIINKLMETAQLLVLYYAFCHSFALPTNGYRREVGQLSNFLMRKSCDITVQTRSGRVSLWSIDSDWLFPISR